MNGEPRYVTLISGESPCRVLDGLADGFMRWLGKERVRLHLVLGPSTDISEFTCFTEVYDWARHGSWDWEPHQSELLVVSTRSFEKVNEWMNAQGFRCALATVDGRDTPCNETVGLEECTHIQVAFKTELCYTNLNANVFSCPFGLVPEPMSPLKPYADRSIPVSFIAGISNITRSAIADAVRTIPGARVELNTHLDRQEYLQILSDSKVSIACYGAGFNSYRYFEIPYCGATLLAQPLPLLMPHNFQSGVHALFFTSPPEVLRMIRWLFDHPTEAEMLARAGTQHLMAHHLTTHRAQYVSAVIRAKMQIKGGEQFLTHFPF